MKFNIRQQKKGEWQQWETLPETPHEFPTREDGMKFARALAKQNDAEVRVTVDDSINGTYIHPSNC